MTRKTDRVDERYSLLTEIRERLAEIEKPFVRVLSDDCGIDLMEMRDTLTPEAFRSYLEAQCELRSLERA